MNKTVNINLSGLIFNIEEAAYDQLKEYLEKVKLNLKNVESQDEIYIDIEIRIAELFQEILGEFKQVIDLSDLEVVITRMGPPEEYVDSDDSYAEHDEAEFVESEEIPNEPIKKRFFRDTRNKWISGVCSGIATYFNIPISLVRILMVVLAVVTSGTVGIFYLVLWFVIPEAVSTADFLSMHGKEANFKNIKNEFKGHAKHHKKEAGKNLKKGNDKFKNFIVKFFRVVARVTGTVLVIYTTILIVFALIGFNMNITSFDVDGISTGVYFSDLISLITETPGDNSLFMAGLYLLVFTPMIIFFLLGVQLLILKSIKGLKYVYIFLGVVFISGIVMTAVSGTKIASNMTHHAEVTEETVVAFEDSVLNLSLMENEVFSSYLEHDYEHFEVSNNVNISKDKLSVGNPNLVIVPTKDSVFKVVIYKRSNGRTKKLAENLAKKIDYVYQIDSTGIQIGSMYQIEKTDKIRAQHIKIKIFVPEGKSLQFGPHIDNMLNWSSSYGLDNYVETYNNKLVTVKDGSFECPSCVVSSERKYRKRHIRISSKKIDDYMDINQEEIVELEID